MLRLRHPVSLLLISLLVLLGVLRSFGTPSPRDAGAPDVVFSADRAEAILRDILPDNLPHPAGSAYNGVVRDRIIQHFESSGYTPEVQARFHCNPGFGTCSPVENLVAVKSGKVGEHAILLTAHYDSSFAGPGAADDGSGVAALLEIARMASEYPPFDNDVIFLVTDSEENGLIGAHAFAEHHPLFARVKAVLNLEARGVTGPSVMFETGEGNRSVIRMLSKNVERPVANSLVYEIYQRMPNDTDYSVYKQRGIMGLNFAFARGVALYHSSLDDPDHLDSGSLQHQGDNAWGMLQALGERDLDSIYHSEEAGYIDLFGTGLIHYPDSIAGGLALVLGVWVMLAIGLAFRKEFRYRQLRWGLIAVPLLLVAIGVVGYLLSWPMGRWLDINPLEHPMPWAGRLTLLLALGLCVYVMLRLFSGRVSACAWMVLAWALVFLLAILLANKAPVLAHIALIPLAGFALGSVVDLFRRKSPAPLLVASVAGFAAAAFVSIYHFFLVDAFVNFDRGLVRILPLGLMAIVAMPMLLAFAKTRELGWRPAGWLAAGVLAAGILHMLLPAYTANRPRTMNMVYSEVDGVAEAYLVLESPGSRHDRKYAIGHDFLPTELDDGRLGRVSRPARPVHRLGLPGPVLLAEAVSAETGGWRRHLLMEFPGRMPFVQLTLPLESGLQEARVNGVTAFDASISTRQPRSRYVIRIVEPGPGPLQIELLTRDAGPVPVALLSWHDLPSLLTAPFMGNWPDDARPGFYGPRAEKIQNLELPAADSQPDLSLSSP